MSKGMTIADFVQQVLYAMYKVRLDVDESKEGSFHSKSDKFKEIVMEANFMLQEFQKEQDWNFLRCKWELGITRNPGYGIQEIQIPDAVYKLCCGYNDAIRLHVPGDFLPSIQVPFDEPRSGNAHVYDMYDEYGQANVFNNKQRAFVVGDTVTFYRRWLPHELSLLIETDAIRYIEPLHICDSSCPDNCPKAYEDIQFKWMPDPYYFVVKTASRRAIADPSCTDVAQSLIDESTKFLSSIRENDSEHNNVDTYQTGTIGYVPVL